MDSLQQFQRNIRWWRAQLSVVKSELAFRQVLRTTVKAGYRDDQPRDDHGRWTSEGGVEVTTEGDFLTGIQSIDEVSEKLSEIMVGVIERLGPLEHLSPSVYGTLVHTAFGSAVKSAGIPGVTDVEQTFLLDTIDPYYGMVGSVRTDAVFRNASGEIMAIYDVKTGDARVDKARADELRSHTSAAPNTPVFELNIVRGTSRKSVLFAFDNVRR